MALSFLAFFAEPESAWSATVAMNSAKTHSMKSASVRARGLHRSLISEEYRLTSFLSPRTHTPTHSLSPATAPSVATETNIFVHSRVNFLPFSSRRSLVLRRALDNYHACVLFRFARSEKGGQKRKRRVAFVALNVSSTSSAFNAFFVVRDVP